MLFHASIPALAPEQVATTLAKLWRGRAFPFAGFPGGYIVVTGDDRGTALEIVPAGQGLVPGPAEVGVVPEKLPPQPTETHVAIGIDRPAGEILAIAEQAGWRARICRRGNFFDVVEVWVENRFLVEALTPEMQAEYTRFMTFENWNTLTADTADLAR